MIDQWIDGEQRRDIRSNAIDPFASFGKLLHGFGRQATGLARGLHDARAGFVLRRLKTGFRRFGGTNFLPVQALIGSYGLDFRPLRVGFLGFSLRRMVDLGAPHGGRGALNIGPLQPGKAKHASREGRWRTIVFGESSPGTRRGCVDPMEDTRGRELRLSVFSTLKRLVRYLQRNSLAEKIIHLIALDG